MTSVGFSNSTGIRHGNTRGGVPHPGPASQAQSSRSLAVGLATLQIGGLLAGAHSNLSNATGATIEYHPFRGGQLLQVPDQLKDAQIFPDNLFILPSSPSGQDPYRPPATVVVNVPAESSAQFTTIDFACASIGTGTPTMNWSDPRQIFRTDTGTLRIDVYSSTNAIKEAVRNHTGGDVYSHQYGGLDTGVVTQPWGGSTATAFNGNYIPFHKITGLPLPEFPVIDGGPTGRQVFIQISIEPKNPDYTDLHFPPLNESTSLVDLFGANSLRPVNTYPSAGSCTTYPVEVWGKLVRAAPPVLALSVAADERLQFRWPMAAGLNFRLQSQSLSPPGPWVDVESGPPTLDGDSYTVRAQASSQPSSFFRLVSKE